MNWVRRGDDDGPSKVLHDDDRTKGGVDVFGSEATGLVDILYT